MIDMDDDQYWFYNSIYDELLLNQHCPMDDDVIKQSLIKAVRLHAVATRDEQFICKYYDKEYNIIRNEQIWYPSCICINPLQWLPTILHCIPRNISKDEH